LQTGRDKDRERVRILLAQARLDMDYLGVLARMQEMAAPLLRARGRHIAAGSAMRSSRQALPCLIAISSRFTWKRCQAAYRSIDPDGVAPGFLQLRQCELEHAILHCRLGLRLVHRSGKLQRAAKRHPLTAATRFVPPG
jgi:hypothetical protein